MSSTDIHCDPTKRHDFVLLFDVSLGNPNGDPDADNLPRVDPETMHGLVTDVCLKRKVRDYAQAILGRPIFIQSKVALNRLIRESFLGTGYEPPETALTEAEAEDDEVVGWINSRADYGFSLDERETNGAPAMFVMFAPEKVPSGKKKKSFTDLVKKQLASDPEPESKLMEKLKGIISRIGDAFMVKGAIADETRQAAQDEMRRKYYDIRMFGAVLQTGLNAGQLRGPMQLTFGRSIEPIVPLDWSITRQARTTSERMLTGQTEMGRKPFVPYGLYLAKGFYSPHLNVRKDNGAEISFATGQDLADFWDALCRMFNLDHSASRGEMYTRGVYVFTHDHPRGNAPSHQLFRLIEEPLTQEAKQRALRRTNGESVQPPRSIADYGPLPAQEQVKEKLAEMKVDGVTVTVLHE